jgi:polyphenol oxidase
MAFDRRPLGDGAYALVSTSLEELGVVAAFTERGGGESEGPFSSLNLSFVVGDDPRSVRANRERVVRGLGVEPFATADQVHGAAVASGDGGHRAAGFDRLDTRIAAADALVTTSRDAPVAVLTADCLPVVMSAPGPGPVAAVHAGWRGLAAGILARALATFADPGDVVVAIGPSVRPCHYEVGHEVVGALQAGAGHAMVERRAGERPRLDLAVTAAEVLEAKGVRRIEASQLCTACRSERFYSHRRDGSRTGRQAAVAAFR